MDPFSVRGFRQVWLALFILGALFINRPFIEIFNHSDRFFGIPLIYCYLFFGWLASIAVIFAFRRILGSGGKE